MRTYLQSLARYIVFWLLLFAVQQALFFAINFDSIDCSWYQLAHSFWMGIKMNLSATVYIVLLPMVWSIVGLYAPINKALNKFLPAYTLVLIVICAFIGTTDAALYRMWGTKITSRALGYLAYPKDLAPTLFVPDNLGAFLVLAAECIGFYKLYQLFFKPFEERPSASFPVKILVSLGLPAVSFIALRGGTQNVPLNRNQVFYSDHAILNYAALNGFWNLADLLNKPPETEVNPYTFMPDDQASQLVVKAHEVPIDTTVSILKTNRPNIVMVFLESWSADVMECLGGEKGITPQFGELAKEGLLFTRCYATGFRTEQGMLALLSAYPAQPTGSIIKQFGKFDKLPNLYRTLKKEGYHPSFYSGGSLQFDNIEGYLRAAGVEQMIGENEWSFTKYTHWGAYDEETFAMHGKAIATLPQPFFTGLTTMITHEAFEGEVPVYFTGDADKTNDAYRNSMHYADSCLFAYIKFAQQQPWYENTLFILVADHGCRFPLKRNNFDIERHKIPMLFIGGALKDNWKGKTFDQTASHTDVAATLLHQLQLDASAYVRSKDLFNPYAPKFAYYAFDNGFGWITDSTHVIYDHTRLQEITGNNAPRLLETGKAYLQSQYRENIEYARLKATP